ncbi:MAG: glycoside hydrolase family 3 N-terminal domain-containing protein [Leptolyngbyaceae bacterium]|nr:glycoside hydrolase family 3 N-terminal domain-containing protein [Leptolyngbyaceae bacterium]
MHSLLKPPLPPVRDLPLRQQIAQMIVVRASGHLFDHQIRYPIWEPPLQRLERWIGDLGVGGVIVLGGSAAEVGLRTQHLQSLGSIPLLIAADVEEGVGQRFDGATWFPPPMAIAHVARHNREQAIRYAQQMGSVTAQEALAIGVNWILAPVVDVNNNSQNPVINVRAFGDQPDIVGALATAFIQGAHQHSVLTSAKHFPGHGDTSTDSHLHLPTLPHDLERLTEVEFPPFQAAITAGVDSVMSAHLLLPTLDADRPATLSPKILTELLREKFKFDGLIVTDALVMGAIAHHYGTNEAAVMAIEAGADVLMMPIDPDGVVNAVEHAVETGRLSADRIQESVERIWWAKQRVAPFPTSAGSSHAWETLPPQPLEWSALSTPEATAQATSILKQSMSVSGDCPIPSVDHGIHVIVLDDQFTAHFLGHHTAAIATPPHYGYTELLIVDRHTPGEVQAFIETNTLPILLQVFVRGNPFRGSAGLSGMPQRWLDALLTCDRLAGVAIYGSPYMIDYVASHRAQAGMDSPLPLVFSYGQMPVAQTLVMNTLFPEAVRSSVRL